MTHRHTHAKKKSKSIIPGFGLSFGIVMAILGIIVVIPLCSLVVFSARLSLSEFWQTITRPRVLSSYAVSLSTAFIASLINAVMGLILAWVLVRYKFPGKRIMDGIIELPFALPTAVAGIALTIFPVILSPYIKQKDRDSARGAPSLFMIIYISDLMNSVIKLDKLCCPCQQV